MTRRTVISFLAVAALVTLAVAHGGASSSEQKNHLTFNRPVALPGVTLPAGSYLFERPLSGVHNMVRVSDARTLRPIFTGFTAMEPRPQDLKAGQVVVLGEAAPGQATPISVWFPIGEPEGHRFLY